MAVKQLFVCVLCGGWWLHMALCTPSGAWQKRRRRKCILLLLLLSLHLAYDNNNSNMSVVSALWPWCWRMLCKYCYSGL